MSDTPPSKDKKVDFILLGSAAVLFLGLFLFSGDDDHGKEDSHGPDSVETSEIVTTHSSDDTAAQTPPSKSVAVKVKPAVVNPSISPTASPAQAIEAVQGTPLIAPTPTIESLQKENAELKAKYEGLRQRIRESLGE